MYNPLDFEAINTYEGTRSPDGTVEYDLTTSYFFRSLYQRCLSIINFNLPETWNKNYFKNVLFGNGFIGVINSPEYGIIPQICTMSGYGLYLEPKRVLVSQPLVNFEGNIGDNCELIRLTPDYRGVCDIIEHYALQLSIAFTSVKTSLFNSRLSYLAVAKNKQAAETLKIIAEKISAGEPVIVYDKMLKDTDLTGDDPIFTEAFDVGNNYITDRLLEDMRNILNDFDREIGIPVIDDKKERRIISEVNMLISDTGSRLETWTECLNDSIARVRQVFPDIEITFDTITERRRAENEPQPETDVDRSV